MATTEVATGRCDAVDGGQGQGLRGKVAARGEPRRRRPGHAYYATRLSDDSKGWVIKVMRGSVSAGRFEQEMRALAGLNSPRIPRVEDYPVEGEDRYYVVRYLGLPLDEFHRARETPMEERLRIFQQIVEAVRDAHSVDVAHRNIKPNNVVVDEARDVSLLDFGICHVVGEEIVHLSSQEKYGNEAFAAPECLQGSAEECSFPADIYSLGKAPLLARLRRGIHPQGECPRGRAGAYRASKSALSGSG